MKPQTRPVKTGTGFPFFNVKIGDRTIGFRVPEIVQAQSVLEYWLNVLGSYRAWEEHASALLEQAKQGEEPEGMEDASRQATTRRGELFGALGFVLLSCWNDSELELESQTAWKNSFQIRQALRHNQPLDRFDALDVEATRRAIDKTIELQTDIKTGFGLVAWDEMVLNGFTNNEIQKIATGAIGLVAKSAGTQDTNEVEILANF